MTKSIPLALPLKQGQRQWLVTIMLALSVFLSCLASAAGLALSDFSRHWQMSLSGAAVIQLPARLGNEIYANQEENMANDSRIAKALAIAHNTPGVSEARLQTRQETSQLVKPWLGDLALSSDLPLPYLINLRLSGDTQKIVEQLRQDLQEEVPSANVEDYGLWRQQVADTLLTAKVIGLLILILGCVTTIVCVIQITTSSMGWNRQPIEILHQIGAEDKFIATQFQSHIGYLTLKGGVWGACAAMAMIIVLGFWVLPPQWRNGWLIIPYSHWLTLWAIPFFLAILAALTARLTVMLSLHRLV